MGGGGFSSTVQRLRANVLLSRSVVWLRRCSAQGVRIRVQGAPVPTASAPPPLMQVAGQHRSTSKGFTLSTFLFVGQDDVVY